MILLFHVLIGGTPAFKSPSAAESSSRGPIEKTFDTINAVLSEDVVKSTQGVYQFNLSGTACAFNHCSIEHLSPCLFMPLQHSLMQQESLVSQEPEPESNVRRYGTTLG